VYTGGTVRAFYLGFALCGWLYALDSVVLNTSRAHPALLTSIVLDQSLPYVIPHVFTRDQSGQISGVIDSYEVSTSSYYQIGHSLWALLSALAGGFAAAYFRDRQVKCAETRGAPDRDDRENA
jgi:hypothetical protein